MSVVLDKREVQLQDAAHERKMIEKQVQLSNDILDKVSALILVADSNGGIQYASRSFEQVLGYLPKDLLNNGWWKVSRPETIVAIEHMREQNRIAKCAVHLRLRPNRSLGMMQMHARDC